MNAGDVRDALSSAHNLGGKLARPQIQLCTTGDKEGVGLIS